MSRETEVAGERAAGSKSAVLNTTADPKGATMLADLDLLLTSVFCTADDLLPAKPGNARRSLTDAEVVTLCVAQSIMGISSDARFVRIARKRLGHLFPALTKRSGFHKRRERLTDTIEALIAAFASQSPGFHDDLLLADSTPVECARSRETVKRAGSSSLGGAIADAADYGYCASHSRYFWGLRLHTLMAPDGTPRAMALTSPKAAEREVCLRLLQRVNAAGPSSSSATRATPAPTSKPTPPPRRNGPPATPQGRARRRAPPCPAAPADRVDLLDRQGHPHPRAPRRPHPARPAGPHRQPLPRPRRRDLAQPPTRATNPGARRLHGLNPWNYSSRPGGSRLHPARGPPSFRGGP